jgi:hypothetical protein
MFSLLISCKFICSLHGEEMFRSELQGVSIFLAFSMAGVSHMKPSSAWSSNFVFHMQFSLPYFIYCPRSADLYLLKIPRTS